MDSPADYASRYKNLPIDFADGSVKIVIERYHIGDPDAEGGVLAQVVKEYFHTHKKKDSTFTLDLFVNGKPTSIPTYEETVWHVAAPFWGKGSPEDCQITAQLAALMKRTSKEHLARYCDQHMGLDCNGFVGNYLFRVHNGNLWNVKAKAADKPDDDLGPSSSMDKFAAAGHAVKDLTSMNPANLHLFIEVDGAYRVISGGKSGAGHIVISEPNKYTPTSFVVNSFGGLDLGYARKGAYGHPALWAVEATGPQGAIGLKQSWYAIKRPLLIGRRKPVSHGIYEVFRGSKATDLNFALVAIPPLPPP